MRGEPTMNFHLIFANPTLPIAEIRKPGDRIAVPRFRGWGEVQFKMKMRAQAALMGA